MVKNLPRDTTRLNIRPALFNIFISDVFFFIEKSEKFAISLMAILYIHTEKVSN